MGYFTELEMFILETIGKNSNRLPTRADFEQMLSAAGGTPIQFSLSVMWLTQAGVDAAMSGNR